MSVDGEGLRPFVVALICGGLCSAVDFFRLIMIMRTKLTPFFLLGRKYLVFFFVAKQHNSDTLQLLETEYIGHDTVATELSV